MSSKETVSGWGSIGLAALFVAGCSSATTYGTGQAPEAAIFKELTGSVGLGGSKKEPIEYRPRSPLVKPPSTALPSPDASVAAADTTNWPDDPDRRRARTASGPRDAFLGLTLDEQRAKEREIAAMPRPEMASDSDRFAPISIHEQIRRDKQFKAAIAKQQGVGASRRYLTEPPDRYREDMGGAPASAAPKKKPGLFSRLFKRSED